MKKNNIFGYIDKVIYDYDLIKAGDRILVGASGGKDSTLLIEYLSRRMKRFSKEQLKALNPDSEKSSSEETETTKKPNVFHHCVDKNPFTFRAVYIKSDFGSDFNEDLKKLFYEWNVDFDQVDCDVLARLKPGRKMSCFWCSMQRRTELIRYAMKNGFNKIALGHHLDDVLETLLMNMTEKGKLETMPPILPYKNYPISIIRPLYYISVDKILAHADEENWHKMTCTCNYQDNSGRKDARKRLEVLTDGDYHTKVRILESLRNINNEYLP